MSLERVVAAVVGVGVLVGLGALYVYGKRKREQLGADEPDSAVDQVLAVSTPLVEAVQTFTGTKVLDRDRAAGVDGRLQLLLDEWERDGTHVVRIAGGTYSGHRYVGGVRDMQQQRDDANAGLSRAYPVDQVDSTRLAPHMHAGALDVWPETFVPNRSFEQQPVADDYVAKFRAFGEFAKERGFTWGGDWSHPDMPHVEVKDWRALPCPPPAVSNG